MSVREPLQRCLPSRTGLAMRRLAEGETTTGLKGWRNVPLLATNVYLYAAQVGDYEKALAAANVSGIPRSNVLGNFSTAWSLVQNGSKLVIAVGGAALFALYYNPCGWSNPNGLAGGHTPFSLFPSGQGIMSAKTNHFANAAGYNSLDSLKLAVMLAYYAVHGTFPYQYPGLPRQEVPQQTCVTGSSPQVVYPPVAGPSPSAPPTASGVGVYATFNSTTDVIRAIQQGWAGIAETGGLGIQANPYTQALSSQPDQLVSRALSQFSGGTWWLSFWTVSWPASGDTFYNAGHEAGVYVASTIMSYKGSVLPSYVILDPEGYNTPAANNTQWSEFLEGWTDGIASVSTLLNPAFYCNQYQYTTFNLASITLPAFIAVSPIQGNTPHVKGGNVIGYSAYYASCPATPYVDQIASWGGMVNTVQFPDSGVDCSP